MFWFLVSITGFKDIRTIAPASLWVFESPKDVSDVPLLVLQSWII
jgi:hypothetical protein